MINRKKGKMKKKNIAIAVLYLIVFVVAGMFAYQRINKNYTAQDNISNHVLFENGDVSYKIVPVYSIVNGNVVFKANFSDANSGISKVEYYLSTSSSAPSASATGWSTTNSFSLTYGTVYYVFARAVDNAGNVNQVSQYIDTFYIPNNIPDDYSIPPGVVVPPGNVVPPTGITPTVDTTTTPTPTNDCDATCYLSNNGANWWDIENSDLTEEQKAALQGALHKDSEEYVNNTNTDAAYSNDGYWTSSNGSVQNDKGASSAPTIGVNENGEAYIQTSNGDTITVQDETYGGYNVIKTEHEDGSTCWYVPGIGNVGSGC